MNSDPFELQATIKKMERGRNARLLVLLVVIAVYAALYGDQLDPPLLLLLLIATAGLVTAMLDIRNARIDTLRANLRVVLIARSPSISHDLDY